MKEAPHRMMMSPGESLLASGHGEEALPYLLRAHEQDPENWRHLSNLGVAYRIIGDLDESISCLVRALSIKAESTILHNLSNTYADQGLFENAKICAAHAFSLNPSRSTGLSLSFALLREGKWGEAWPLYEYGRNGESWSPLGQIPVWKGEPLTNKRILVLREGGYGDSFLYMRYFPQLSELGAEVTFLVWESQVGILSGMGFRVQSDQKPVNPFDYDFQVPIMSLPFFFNASPNVTEPLERTIFPDKESVGRWKAKLENGGRLKVGICWDAQEATVPRKFRSIPVKEIEPLREVPVRWINLVKGVEVPKWIENHPLGTWGETAALMDSLDLIVSVDTAVAHLGGCLEKPTMVILPINSDWKWLLGTDRSVWYKSLTLIRNTHSMSFFPAIKVLKESLLETLRG